jgi:hypothetical protein
MAGPGESLPLDAQKNKTNDRWRSSAFAFLFHCPARPKATNYALT